MMYGYIVMCCTVETCMYSTHVLYVHVHNVMLTLLFVLIALFLKRLL